MLLWNRDDESEEGPFFLFFLVDRLDCLKERWRFMGRFVNWHPPDKATGKRAKEGRKGLIKLFLASSTITPDTVGIALTVFSGCTSTAHQNLFPRISAS